MCGPLGVDLIGKQPKLGQLVIALGSLDCYLLAANAVRAPARVVPSARLGFHLVGFALYLLIDARQFPSRAMPAAL